MRPLLVKFAPLTCHIEQYANMEFLGDRNTDESPESPRFLHRFTPTRNGTSASVLRIEQEPTEPFYPSASIIFKIIF